MQGIKLGVRLCVLNYLIDYKRPCARIAVAKACVNRRAVKELSFSALLAKLYCLLKAFGFTAGSVVDVPEGGDGRVQIVLIENDVLLAKKENLWGVINTNGKEILPLQYDEICFLDSCGILTQKKTGEDWHRKKNLKK